MSSHKSFLPALSRRRVRRCQEGRRRMSVPAGRSVEIIAVTDVGAVRLEQYLLGVVNQFVKGQRICPHVGRGTGVYRFDYRGKRSTLPLRSQGVLPFQPAEPCEITVGGTERDTVLDCQGSEVGIRPQPTGYQRRLHQFSKDVSMSRFASTRITGDPRLRRASAPPRCCRDYPPSWPRR